MTLFSKAHYDLLEMFLNTSLRERVGLIEKPKTFGPRATFIKTERSTDCFLHIARVMPLCGSSRVSHVQARSTQSAGRCQTRRSEWF